MARRTLLGACLLSVTQCVIPHFHLPEGDGGSGGTDDGLGGLGPGGDGPGSGGEAPSDGSGGDGDGGSGGDGDGGSGGDGGGAPPACGDGNVDPGESCDDDDASGGGCTAACSREGVVVTCGDVGTFACGDGLDNDGDDKVDSDDPDCTGACDGREDDYGTSIAASGCLGDCYFDATAGSGDDDCSFDLRCDPLSPQSGCAFNSQITCAGTSPGCLTDCGNLTPNGCDCQGCCQFAGGARWLGSGGDCAPGNLTACAPCTQLEDCVNPCNAAGCELCFGQTVLDLLPACGGVPACPGATVSCTSIDDCAAGEYCLTGCCRPGGLP